MNPTEDRISELEYQSPYFCREHTKEKKEEKMRHRGSKVSASGQWNEENQSTEKSPWAEKKLEHPF